MNDVSWFKKAIIYHIFIDRFAGFESTDNWDKPIFLGGNLKGIVQKLSYLQNLGINTLWISPFYKTSAYHGYHITDFYDVDHHFGTLSDLKELIKEVHKRDMKIIADFVPNHCSKDHPFFKEAQQIKNSPYFDWFYFTNWPDDYLCFLSIKEIPKLNLNNSGVKEHIIGAAKYWLNQGFDGFRLDHVLGPPHNFWKDFRKEIKKDYPSAVLIGEAWMMGIKRDELKTINVKNKFIKWLFGSASDRLLKEYLGELDGVLDFRFQEIIRRYIKYPNTSENTLNRYLKKHYSKFPKDYFLPTFLDNHDMDRFLFLCGNDKEKLKKAVKIQFSIDQPPIIYYGTEQAITQEKSIWDCTSHGDLQARKPMNWDNDDTELLNFYKKMIKYRIKNK